MRERATGDNYNGYVKIHVRTPRESRRNLSSEVLGKKAWKNKTWKPKNDKHKKYTCVNYDLGTQDVVNNTGVEDKELIPDTVKNTFLSSTNLLLFVMGCNPFYRLGTLG